MTVGFPFLGQFVDHDLTFDPMPIRCNLPASPNLRSRFFDLDSIYGRGPDEDRLLYDRASELDRAAPIKFFVDFDAARDLPRTSQERAIIADPRNDENVIISQLHLAFLKFHNEVSDYLAVSSRSRQVPWFHTGGDGVLMSRPPTGRLADPTMVEQTSALTRFDGHIRRRQRYERHRRHRVRRLDASPSDAKTRADM